MQKYIVSLFAHPGVSETQTLFECQAEDEIDAERQALEKYPGCVITFIDEDIEDE